MYFLYSLLLVFVCFLSFPFFFAKMIFARKNYGKLSQKMGFLPRDIGGQGRPKVWVHAVSVGEVSAIHPLVRELRKAYPQADILLSTGTASGQAVARERVKEADSVFYFPLDLPWVVRRVLRRIRPEVFITAETELWPNFLRIMKEQGGRTMLANGRISDRSFQRYKKTRFFWTPVLDHFDVLSMIRVEDGERIISIGADPLSVCINGNCKFDQAAYSADAAFRAEMEELLGFRGGETVFVAGSTHAGEEELLLEAYVKMCSRFPEMILLLVPRHVERAPQIEKLFPRFGLEGFRRRSQIAGRGIDGNRVVLWDTFGELFKVYSVATLVYCGASLVPLRGQNILEPAAWGKVVFYGPSMEDFQDACQLLERVYAGIRVQNIDELVGQGIYLLEHPKELASRGQAGRDAVLANQGATRRNMELVRKLIESDRAGARAGAL